MKIVIASKNQGKIKEFNRILEQLSLKAISQSDAGLDLEVEETGDTFAQNALLKAQAISKAGNCIAIADDSGLCVDALGGAPGIYSARYAGENATDLDRMEKLLEAMKDVPLEKRTARFVCAICCVFPNGDIIQAQGVCEGTIGFAPVGEDGFGYDPLFMVGDKSFAQMSPEQKDGISHRGQALRDFAVLLKDYLKKGELK